MDIQFYANVAEIVGGILVVVTLIFLTVQIRQNTQAMRSTTIQSTMQSEMAFSNILVQNADVWEKMLTAQPLSEGEETRRAIVIYNTFMIDTESRWQQYRHGYLDVQNWEGRSSQLGHIVSLPIYQLWKHSPGALSHSPEFLALLEQHAESQL